MVGHLPHSGQGSVSKLRWECGFDIQCWIIHCMSGRGAHTKNISSHPIVESHPYTWEHYRQISEALHESSHTHKRSALKEEKRKAITNFSRKIIYFDRSKALVFNILFNFLHYWIIGWTMTYLSGYQIITKCTYQQHGDVPVLSLLWLCLFGTCIVPVIINFYSKLIHNYDQYILPNLSMIELSYRF